MLAAGKSTRIRTISQGKAKLLLPIAGRSIIKRNLDWLKDNAIAEVYINLHFQAEEIKKELSDYLGITQHLIEEKTLLGTAGALINVCQQQRNTKPWLVIYGDNLFKMNLQTFFSHIQNTSADIVLTLFDTTKNKYTGIVGGRVRCDSEKNIIEFKEGDESYISNYANAGVCWLNDKAIKKLISQNFFDLSKDFFPYVISQSELKIKAYLLPANEFCLGLDTPESYKEGVAILQEQGVLQHDCH
ncbi:MAG: hypothetical protein A3E87_01965 [Gammaproteobacteria bacterium RIFCSPHIGHO2_12_FULL_35_23]|nr:MAG: hypothetical protein A3E87_01965 [Gammaproteobacteria bacterium RIFCSPHIGHO2_12_FULL_35_23]